MIRVEHVSRAFGGVTAVSDVSLEAPNGEVTGFVGPNGAGKTTIMKIICGLLPADAGAALVDGVPFVRTARPGRALGIHLGGEWLPAGMSGEHLLRFAADTMRGRTRDVGGLLALTGLRDAARARIGTYSLGMRQRLGIALALLGDPDNLVLDEPVNGLDPHGVIWLRNLLRAEAESGKAVLLSSHLMAELELVADRVVMLDRGRVLREGRLADLHEAPDAPVHVRSDDLPAALDLLRGHGYTVRVLPDGALVEGSDPATVGRIVFGAGLTLTHLEVQRSSLEEVFLRSTTNRQHLTTGPA